VPYDEEDCVVLDHWCAVNFVNEGHYTRILKLGLVCQHNFGGAGMR